MRTIIICAVVIVALSTQTSCLSPEVEQLKNDFVIKTSKPSGHRLAGWQILLPKDVKCDITRPKIKTFGYCWEDENEAKGINTTKERGWVREAIQQWEKCGGIKFVEEQECRMGPDFVKIRVGSYRPMVSPFMDDGTCKINGFKMFLDFYTFGPYIDSYRKTEKLQKSNIQMYALHEFGHFLGFDHEHNRKDRTGECVHQPDSAIADGIYGTSYITKEYDADSIMNYCTQWIHYKPWLSKLDKEAVAKIYGGGNKKECDAATKPWKWQDGDGLDPGTLLAIQKEGGYAPCVDVMPSKDCETHSSQGACTNPGMDYWCYKTCKFCK